MIFTGIKKNVFVPLLLLCGENVQPADWTSTHHIQISYILLNSLKRDIFHQDSIMDLLKNHPDMLKLALSALHEKLTAKDWKYYPGKRLRLEEK